jgi:hypothetical protein
MQIEPSGNADVIICYRRCPTEPQTETLIQGVDLPEYESLGACERRRVSFDAIGSMIASCLAELGS